MKRGDKVALLTLAGLAGGVVLVGYLATSKKKAKPPLKRHGWTVSADCTKFHQDNMVAWSVFMENYLATVGANLGWTPSSETARQILTGAFAAAFPECPSPPEGATLTGAAIPGLSFTWDEAVAELERAWGGLEAATPFGTALGSVTQ